jgi:hypothetical protein
VVSLPGGDTCSGASLDGGGYRFSYAPAKGGVDGPTELLIPFGDAFYWVGLRTQRLECRLTATGELADSADVPVKLDDAQAAGDRLVGLSKGALIALDLAQALGAELWRVDLKARDYQWRATPAAVFAHTPGGELCAIAVESGQTRWRVEVPSSFLAEADASGVLLLSGSTVSERASASGEQRWAYSDSEHRVHGLGLGSKVALIRRVVGVKQPSDDPFAFATYVDQHQLVGVRVGSTRSQWPRRSRASCVLRFMRITGAPGRAGVVVKDTAHSVLSLLR